MSFFPFQAAAENPQLGMVLGVLVGFGFGFVLERAGFGNSRKLAAQFYGTEMVMLKVMFTAIVTAVLGTVVLSGLGLLDLRTLADSVASDTFLWPMIAGGFLIGVGIIFSGYCPGTSLVGIASGKLDALLAYLGVVIGQVIWAELEFRGPIARFHESGALGHVYLYDLVHVSPAVVAAAVVAMAAGAFFLGEKIERLVTKIVVAGPSPRRWVFGGMAGFGVVALATLAVPRGTMAGAAPTASISAEALARRILDEPWKVRVLDVRPLADCAAQRIPGAECGPLETLKALALGDASPARDLVVVAATGQARLPAEILAYQGKILVLQNGFEGWRDYALSAPPPPAPEAGEADREAWRIRSGIHAVMTGVKQAPPPAAPAAGAVPVKRKASGGGCSG